MAEITKAVARLTRNISIDPGGCWNCTLKPRPNGYVRVTFERKSWYAHRLMFFSLYGPIQEGHDICHSCDNRRCINPHHLFSGTRKDNMQDAVRKGRQAKGYMLPGTKVAGQEEKELLLLCRAGSPHAEIAELFGISRQGVGKIAIKNGIRRRKYYPNPRKPI